MERHSLRALLGIGVLVILAWLGIVLFAKIRTGSAPVVLIILWVLAALAALAMVLWSVRQARKARLERESERARGLR